MIIDFDLGKECDEFICGIKMWEFVVFIILILVIIFILFQWTYNNSLFSPSNEINHLTDKNYKNIYIGVKTGRYGLEKHKNEENINVWHFDNYPGKKTVLFFHGNSGNISNRSYVMDICEKFELNLLLVDYRGYGDSDGEPKISNLCEDGEFAYSYLVKDRKVKKENIIVWGESLGTGVGVYLASKMGARCLILLSPYSSLEDVISEHEAVDGVTKMAARGFIKITGNEMNSKEWIKNIKCPVLIIHSKEDKLISYKSAKLLFKNIPRRHKKFITITGDHSKPKIRDDQLDELFSFIGIKRHKHNLKIISDDLEKVARENNWA